MKWRRQFDIYRAKCDTHLNAAEHAGRLHARRHVHRVAPNVVLRLGGADDARHHGPDVDADAQLEVVEAVLVDAVQHLHHGEGEVGERDQVVLGALLVLNADAYRINERDIQFLNITRRTYVFVVLVGADVEACCSHVAGKYITMSTYDYDNVWREHAPLTCCRWS